VADASDLVGREVELAGIALEPTFYGGGARLAVLGEIYAAAGTNEQRRRLRGQLLAVADREVFFGHAVMAYEGPVRRALGLLEAALGDVAVAEVHLRAALERCRRHDLRPWVARIAYELATVLAGAGRASEAAALSAEAARLADELGIAGLAARAQRMSPAPRRSRG